MEEEIQFFRVDRNGANGAEFIAASSRGAASDLLKKIGGFNLGTLRQIREREATQAEYYDAFARERKLCPDGTYDLGSTKNDASS